MSSNSENLRVAFQTFGCRSNYADTIDLQAALVEKGAKPCQFDSEADVYVINTCTVTDQADKEALKLIKKARAKNPEAKIVVTGCMAEVGKKQIEALGAADSIVSPGKKSELLKSIITEDKSTTQLDPELPKKRKERLLAKRSISLDGKMSEAIEGPGSKIGELGTRARYHLRVQEGCENFCTFCIIPESRGAYSSRKLKDVLDDLKRLELMGYEEIVLTGTHLGGYGLDIGSSFYQLLLAVEELQTDARIRISSIDPNDLTPEIIDLLSKSNVFCEHLHICVQAFSDKILKRMRRRYLMDDVEFIVRYITENYPGYGIGSDLITGFPGESRDDVEQGIATFLGLPFSYLHVFPYSERSGTAATKLDSVVEFSERKRRAARWRALSERRKQEFYEGLISSELEFIAERIESGFVYGTSREYAAVKAKVSGERPKIGTKIRAQALDLDIIEGRIECRLLSPESLLEQKTPLKTTKSL